MFVPHGLEEGVIAALRTLVMRLEEGQVVQLKEGRKPWAVVLVGRDPVHLGMEDIN